MNITPFEQPNYITKGIQDLILEPTTFQSLEMSSSSQETLRSSFCQPLHFIEVLPNNLKELSPWIRKLKTPLKR